MAKGRKLKIFSFFAGCGILDLGFEKAGYDIEFVNEFFKPFQDAYIYSRKMMKIRPPKYGYANTDVNSYINENKHQLEQFIEDAKKDGSLIGFIGGPPCPDFSIDQSVQTVGCGHDIAIRFLPTLRVYVVIYCIASFHVETASLMTLKK